MKFLIYFLVVNASILGANAQTLDIYEFAGINTKLEGYTGPHNPATGTGTEGITMENQVQYAVSTIGQKPGNPIIVAHSQGGLRALAYAGKVTTNRPSAIITIDYIKKVPSQVTFSAR